VFVERRMFATLDPTSRRLKLPRDREVVINDTVGFIRDLPPELLSAFRATLEEIEDSQLIVHVVDASHEGHPAQIRAVEKILGELGYEDLPSLLVLNKVDRMSEQDLSDLLVAHDRPVAISALNGTGIETLLTRIESVLPRRARGTFAPRAAAPPAFGQGRGSR